MSHYEDSGDQNTWNGNVRKKIDKSEQHKQKWSSTVEPVLSGTESSGHLVLSSQFSKTQN